MNLIGSVGGGGAIAHPFGLIISNLPTIMCALVVATNGPGAFSLRLGGAAVGADSATGADPENGADSKNGS
jgi:hypothetical protein